MLTLEVRKTILIFSALIIALLSLFQLSKYSVLAGDLKIEWSIGIIAIIFFFVGLYINRKGKSQQGESTPAIDKQTLKSVGLSSREYEILQEISNGLSNKEIADKLFVSESTVKTHVSNLFIKLNAKRRTQAIKNAKSLKIIA